MLCTRIRLLIGGDIKIDTTPNGTILAESNKMSQFYIPSSTTTTATTTATTSAYGSDDEDTLPYPSELPRSDFLALDFDPQLYLSSLRNRHQTLEDLRTDLRQRSQLLNRELLDLVNANYEEFLSLGADLQGGEEKVEGVRVGVLGFQREVKGLSKVVKERQEDMARLLAESGVVREEIRLGRALVEVHERIGEMEVSLGITEQVDDDEGDDFDEDEDLEDPVVAVPLHLKRLQRQSEQYLLLMGMVERIGSSHPFLQAQKSRLAELRKTLLLDLATALRQAKKQRAADDLLLIVRLYGDLGAEVDSVRVLRGG